MKRENFLKDQRAKPPPVLHEDLSDKVVLVIGANTGLGFETCLHFSRMKPKKLIMTARNQDKAQDALSRLAQQTSYKATSALVDFGSFSSVRAFCDHISDTNPSGIDIVLISAGVMGSSGKYVTSQDDWQIELQVNHISAAWVVLRLLPVVSKKPDGRIVMVPTDLHFYVTIEDNLSSDKEGILRSLSREEYFYKLLAKQGLFKNSIVPFNLYDKTKLVSLLFMRALVAHFPTTSPMHPLVLGCEPGYCQTELSRDLPRSMWVTRLLSKVVHPLLALPAEVGGRNFVFGCLAGEKQFGKDWKAKMQGGYVKFGRISRPSDFVEGKEGQAVGERIFDETITLLKGLDPKLNESLEGLNL